MAEMARDVSTVIRYDGPDLSGHEIDIQELAPALLALSDMVQLTNRKFNGDDVKIRVLVKADIEQKCFQLEIHIVQSLLEAAKHLFSTEQYKTAKDIAELLDLLLPAGLSGGVFYAWKKIWGTKEEQEKPLSSYEIEQENGNTTILNFYGDGNHLNLSNDTFNLATDPEMIRLGKRVMKPLEQKGIDSLGFYQNDQAVVEYGDEVAGRFIKRAPEVLEKVVDAEIDIESAKQPVQHVDGQFEIVTAQYVGSAQWGLRWLGKIRSMKMADEAWLSNYQKGREPDAVPGAWLDAHLEIEQHDDDINPTYTITRVKRVIRPEAPQEGFFDDKP